MWVANNFHTGTDGTLKRAFSLQKCQEIQNLCRPAAFRSKRMVRADGQILYRFGPANSIAIIAMTKRGLR